MKARCPLFFCLLVGTTGAQGLPVTVLSEPRTVSSVGTVATAVGPRLQSAISNQQGQIAEATKLNRSTGYWGNDVRMVSSDRLSVAGMARDYLQEMRQGLDFDYRPELPPGHRSVFGTSVDVKAEDLADFNLLDQIGEGTASSLSVLAQAIDETNGEIAKTYAAMTAHGQTQQKFEKYRGKLQALQMQLENLQGQERTALDLLQAQATQRANQLSRHDEISTLVQEANHTETVTAISVLKLDELAWR